MAFNDDGGWEGQEEGLKGVDLIIGLLLDKLDIVAGKYQFPLMAHAGTAPALVVREGEV